MQIVKRIVSLFVLLGMITGIIIPVYADELKEKQEQLQEINQRIYQQQKNIQEAQQRENTIMGQLQSLQKDINRTENDLEFLIKQINDLQKDIKQTEEEIAAMEEQLEVQSEILSDRLVHIYEKGQASYLEVLLAATDVRDFLTRYEMLNYIVKQDVDLIETIAAKKEELTEKKAALEKKAEELEAIEKEQENKREQLRQQKNNQDRLLTNVRREKSAYEQALAELEQTSKQIEAMIRQIQSGGGNPSLGTGTYTWPTPGYTGITSPYGMRFHPVLKENRMHTGVDLRAPMGANIVAADSGTIIQTGWMGGYGQVVIIDHGNQVSTLYAHQSKILVNTGDTVYKGQTIGKVGSTGWSTGPHLHFEVRINGKHTDPMQYISK
ncbi:MAG: murein hydrolase activator EnvC family protein [Syntrophomonadaceae bacterium]